MSLLLSLTRQLAGPSGATGRSVASWAGRSSAPFNEWLVGHLSLSTSSRVLDLGCGTGVGSEAVLGIVPDGFVDALDHSPDMVAATRARNARAVTDGRLAVHEADAADLPFKAATFDAVIGVHVAYFWPDVASAVAEIARVLKPGGQVGLGITYAHNMPGRSARRYQALGFHTFAPSDLAEQLRGSGFTRVREDAQPGDRGVMVHGWMPAVR